jgi:hypothetical protein
LARMLPSVIGSEGAGERGYQISLVSASRRLQPLKFAPRPSCSLPPRRL